VPPDSFRCTRTVQLQTSHYRVFTSALRYNSPDCPVCHRTVRCTSGVTAIQRKRSTATDPCNATVRAEVRAVVRGVPDNEQCLSYAAPDCPMPLEDKASNGQKLSNPNGWVTWLAHLTVRCAHRQQPPPTACWWLRAINTPTTTTPSIQVSSTAHSIQKLVHSLLDKSKESKPLQVPNPLQPLSDLRECFVCVLCALVAWITFFLPHSCSQVNCNQSKRHQVCGGPCGV
jgi:hypothetical protein